MTQESNNGDDFVEYIERGNYGKRKTLLRYSHIFSVTLNDDLNNRLLRLCHEKNLDKTAVVRAALARCLPKYDEKTEGVEDVAQ